MATDISDILGEESAEDSAQLEEMRQAEHIEAPAEEVPAEDVQEEKAEAAPAEDAPAEEAPKQTVPYGVLREERDKRQELENKLSQTTAQIQRMEQTFQQLLQRTQQANQPAPPDPDLDPDGYTAHQLQQVNAKLERQEQIQQQTAQQTQQAQQAKQFIDMYANAAQDFAREKPDVKDAYDFVLDAMDKELELRGLTDPTERARLLEFEEEQIVKRAFQVGKNPAAQIYAIAEYRGYKPVASNPEPDKIDAIAKTEAATATLANASGGGEPPVTLQRLAELEGDEFDKAWNDARKKGLLG